ncbi:MAG: peptidoglycan recognition family protein [Ferruginibacter sp.]
MTLYRYCILAVACFLGSCKASQQVIMPAGMSIISREEWGAAAPVMKMSTHVPKQITIHHTAVKQNFNRTLRNKLKALQKFSMERSPLSDGRIKEPWADIPYHFYIDVNGTIAEGRELQYVGDSNTPYDPTGHALIVLEGNFNEEQLTEKQSASLEKLVVAIAKQYHISPDKISGHKDHASTGCPGDHLYALIPHLKQAVAAAK